MTLDLSKEISYREICRPLWRAVTTRRKLTAYLMTVPAVKPARRFVFEDYISRCDPFLTGPAEVPAVCGGSPQRPRLPSNSRSEMNYCGALWCEFSRTMLPSAHRAVHLFPRQQPETEDLIRRARPQTHPRPNSGDSRAANLGHWRCRRRSPACRHSRYRAPRSGAEAPAPANNPGSSPAGGLQNLQ